MKNRLGIILLFLATITVFISCVPQKKFLAMQDRANRLNKDSVNFYNQILGLNGSLSKLQMEQEMTQSKLQKSKEQLSNSNETIATQQARLAELQQRIEQQKLASESLRKKIADALGSFNAEQLTVSLKNGKVYVSMSEQLLFASGSADAVSYTHLDVYKRQAGHRRFFRDFRKACANDSFIGLSLIHI